MWLTDWLPYQVDWNARSDAVVCQPSSPGWRQLPSLCPLQTMGGKNISTTVPHKSMCLPQRGGIMVLVCLGAHCVRNFESCSLFAFRSYWYCCFYCFNFADIFPFFLLFSVLFCRKNSSYHICYLRLVVGFFNVLDISLHLYFSSILHYCVVYSTSAHERLKDIIYSNTIFFTKFS